MDPLPPAAAVAPELWPDAGDDGNTVIGPAAAAQIFGAIVALVDYLEQQYAACAKAAPGAAADR